MKKAFLQLGIEVGGGSQLLEEDELLEFCRLFKPDAILEMNRSRAQIPFLPRDIVHIAYIVDLMGNQLEYFNDSEVIYWFAYIWHYRSRSSDRLLNEIKAVIIDWLPPGFDPNTYYPEPDRKKEVDFSFMGHIPLPWTTKELQRTVSKKNGNPFSFKDFILECENPENHHFLYYKTWWFLSTLGIDTGILDESLRYDIECRTGRLYNRKRLMDAIASFSDSISIYGPENWQAWEVYKPFYKTYISDPNQMRLIIQTSRFSLHEGNGTHFRLFDCMGAGGCVFYYENPYKNLFPKTIPRGIDQLFEAGKHYVTFSQDNAEEKARYYTENTESRERIVKSAYRLVHAKHQWFHRAEKIYNDIQTLG